MRAVAEQIDVPLAFGALGRGANRDSRDVSTESWDG